VRSNKITRTPVETKVRALTQHSPFVNGLPTSSLIDTRHGSSEDLLVANPNHRVDQYDDDGLHLGSDMEVQTTGSDTSI
jgi:hypothetical protein